MPTMSTMTMISAVRADDGAILRPQFRLSELCGRGHRDNRFDPARLPQVAGVHNAARARDPFSPNGGGMMDRHHYEVHYRGYCWTHTARDTALARVTAILTAAEICDDPKLAVTETVRGRAVVFSLVVMA